MGLLEALTLLFTGLKLTDNIDWSWWQVTAPLWVGYPVLILVGLTFGLLGVILKSSR